MARPRMRFWLNSAAAPPPAGDPQAASPQRGEQIDGFGQQHRDKTSVTGRREGGGVPVRF